MGGDGGGGGREDAAAEAAGGAPPPPHRSAPLCLSFRCVFVFGGPRVTPFRYAMLIHSLLWSPSNFEHKGLFHFVWPDCLTSAYSPSFLFWTLFF